MFAIQPFKKTDPLEEKVTQAFLETLASLGTDRDQFYSEAYANFQLGDVLYETRRHPLAGVLTQDVFRTCLPEIHQLFTRPGTFEFYLSLFRKIWGEEVDITFTVPGPGKLVIATSGLYLELFEFGVREIVDDAYVFHTLVTSVDEDSILVQGAKGIKTQSETDALLKEIVPAGIWVDGTLTFVFDGFFVITTEADEGLITEVFEDLTTEE